jgi:hypothetical protein
MIVDVMLKPESLHPLEDDQEEMPEVRPEDPGASSSEVI